MRKFPGKHVEQHSFTLVEVLVVISIILILAGITLGISQGVNQRAARARAKGELAILAQALEQYKLHYGDYPWVETGGNGANELLMALFGDRSPQGDPISPRGPHFIELGKFKSLNNQILDPWGKPYAYKYKTVESEGVGWDRFGFVLMSYGPDQKDDASNQIPDNGILDSFLELEDQKDNIVYGE